MSHFYAMIPNSARKTVPTARGHKTTGIETVGASYSGAVRVALWHDEREGVDKFEVAMTPWQGAGDTKVLARGTVGDASIVELPIMSNGGNYFLTDTARTKVHAKD